MAWDHNYARIPDEENTDGGGGRESDQFYAEIPDEENNEVPESSQVCCILHYAM